MPAASPARRIRRIRTSGPVSSERSDSGRWRNCGSSRGLEREGELPVTGGGDRPGGEIRRSRPRGRSRGGAAEHVHAARHAAGCGRLWLPFEDLDRGSGGNGGGCVMRGCRRESVRTPGNLVRALRKGYEQQRKDEQQRLFHPRKVARRRAACQMRRGVTPRRRRPRWRPPGWSRPFLPNQGSSTG